MSKRAKKLGGHTHEGDLVPVVSTADYFRHISVVEPGFTSYRPLRRPSGE